MSNNFMSNFAMIIPQAPTPKYIKPKPSKWKRYLCLGLGHKWGFAGITYTGPGFPKKCSRCKTTKWFKRPNLRMRLNKWVDISLDKMWSPFCEIGIHRYKSHYGFQSFYYGPGPHEPPIKQEIYKCSCCKKIKTVNV